VRLGILAFATSRRKAPEKFNSTEVHKKPNFQRFSKALLFWRWQAMDN